jgi:GT2 family glycosyltransferase
LLEATRSVDEDFQSQTMASRPTIYIPNLDGRDRLAALLESLRGQTRTAEVVLVDNGSRDGSQELLRGEFPEVELIELGENLGFGPALNRAVAATDGDPVVLLNNDVVCDPRFLEALLEPVAAGAEMVAGVLLGERDPRLVDSAGVIADRTLMGFDYLHGERREEVAAAPPPLGPTGGAALFSRAAFDAVGGFDERIFLYYEDLDLALRMRAAGARCELAPEAAAVHAYSQTLGAASGAKYARTGWSRGYMLRRYGVMSRPRDALRVLAAEGAICAGQILKDRTAKGLGGRLRGWRDGRGLAPRRASPDGLSELSLGEALALRRARRGPR